MRIYVHTRHPEKSECDNEFFEFARIPVVGEYLKTSTHSSWFQAVIVLHTPFLDRKYDAEIYAVRVDPTEITEASGFKGVA